MSINLSIKDVPEDVAERLRQRAARNHRSLQGELLAIVELAARQLPAPAEPEEGRRQGWKTVEQLLAERRASGWRTHPSAAGTPLAVDLVRADRDRR